MMSFYKGVLKNIIWGSTGLAMVLGFVSPVMAAPSAAAPEALPSLDHPRLSPSRDVVVVYHFQTAEPVSPVVKKRAAMNGENEVTVSFASSGDRLRIEQANHKTATILDRPAQKVTLINMENRTYAQLMPLHGLRNPFLLDLNMRYKAGGHVKVAGYDCQNWAIESKAGKAQACVTDDGVILSESGVDADGMSGHLEATSVEYRDIPATEFDPPADFKKLMPRFRNQKGAASPVPGTTVPQANAPAEAPASRVTPSVPEPSPGVEPSAEAAEAQPEQDKTQPSLPNDSASDGTVSHADQPGLNQ